MGVPDRIGRRALGRALLERQLLLERRPQPVGDALEHLVGLQGQAPDAPYVGLWSRLAGFRPGELGEALVERRVVRIPLMRATIHLVTARDAAALRPAVQPVLERSFAGTPFARDVAGIDVEELHAVARRLLDERPRGRSELARLLGERWPGRDGTSLAYAVTYRLPLVHVPPRGAWGATGPAAWVPASSWLDGAGGDGGGGDGTGLSPDELVLRYLAAFGPASVRDVQTWSGLTRLAEVVDRLGPRLRPFRDEAGTVLVDLPDAPRPEPDSPAPPRFLPEYDNVLLSHADRARINPDLHRVPLPPGQGAARGTVLVDGEFRGTWALARPDAGGATVTVRPFRTLAPPDAEAVTAEAARLLDLVAPGPASGRRAHDVRVEA